MPSTLIPAAHRSPAEALMTERGRTQARVRQALQLRAPHLAEVGELLEAGHDLPQVLCAVLGNAHLQQHAAANFAAGHSTIS